MEGRGVTIDDEMAREARLLRRYGITQLMLDTMMAEQNYGCGSCGEYLADPQVDHCHETRKVRGLLCRNCNTGLGQFKDDPVRISKALTYLLTAQARDIEDLEPDSVRFLMCEEDKAAERERLAALHTEWEAEWKEENAD
jgi:Recombination endonuclease VII